MGWARLAAVLAAVLLAPALGGVAELVAIRFYPSAQYSRLVLEGPDLPEHRLLRLHNPDRLVLDVYVRKGDELLIEMGEKELAKIPYLRRVRSARHDRKRLRFVFDLVGRVEHSLFTLQPVDGYHNHRLVLDFAPPDDTRLLVELGIIPDTAPVPPRLAPLRGNLFVVAIDPGHGGEDPGAVGRGRLYEKNVVLDICKRLKKKLSAMPEISPRLIRDSDVFVSLATRVRMAQDMGADLFVSVHADSFDSAGPRGASVYLLSEKGASSKLARQLARQANRSDLIGGINLSASQRDRVLRSALKGIFRDGRDRASRGMAEIFLKRMMRISKLHFKVPQHAGFAVLKSPRVPSVLVEVGFISNPQDARRLVSAGYRDMLAKELAIAIGQYRSRFDGLKVSRG